MGNWYKISVNSDNKRGNKVFYLFASRTISLLTKYYRIPFIRDHEDNHEFPVFTLLSDEESSRLEKILLKRGKRFLTKAKRRWYCGKT